MALSGPDVASFTVPGSKIGHADTRPLCVSADFRRECRPKNAGNVHSTWTPAHLHTPQATAILVSKTGGNAAAGCRRHGRRGRLRKAWHAIDYTPTHIKQKGASPAERFSRHSSGQALTQQPFRPSVVKEAEGVFFCKVSPFLDSSFGCLQEVFQGVEAKGPLPLPPALPLLVQQV